MPTKMFEGYDYADDLRKPSIAQPSPVNPRPAGAGFNARAAVQKLGNAPVGKALGAVARKIPYAAPAIAGAGLVKNITNPELIAGRSEGTGDAVRDVGVATGNTLLSGLTMGIYSPEEVEKGFSAPARNLIARTLDDGVSGLASGIAEAQGLPATANQPGQQNGSTPSIGQMPPGVIEKKGQAGERGFTTPDNQAEDFKGGGLSVVPSTLERDRQFVADGEASRAKLQAERDASSDADIATSDRNSAIATLENSAREERNRGGSDFISRGSRRQARERSSNATSELAKLLATPMPGPNERIQDLALGQSRVQLGQAQAGSAELGLDQQRSQADLVKRLRDPNLAPEQRRALTSTLLAMQGKDADQRKFQIATLEEPVDPNDPTAGIRKTPYLVDELGNTRPVGSGGGANQIPAGYAEIGTTPEGKKLYKRPDGKQVTLD